MSNSEASTNVLVPLSNSKKLLTTIGSALTLVAFAMTIAGNVIYLKPILTEMNQMATFTLVITVVAMAQTILNPIGGKLGEILGKRNLIVICMIGSVISMAICAFTTNFIIMFIARTLIAVFQGACIAAPYVIAREINTPQEAPKFMGILASGISLGGLLGGLVTGLLVDMNLTNMSMIVYAIPALIAAILIGLSLPNTKNKNVVRFDMPGAVFMSITIICFLLGINMIGKLGQGGASIGSILGFMIAAIVSGFILVKIENKSSNPLISMRLFTNGKYVCMLLAGGCATFYLTAISNYAPIAITDIMNGTSTQAGALQIPRTILVLILPAFIGAWVGKNKGNIWKAVAMSCAIVTVAMLPFCFIVPTTSITFLIILLAFTGIAESFRSVAITPGAQSFLTVEDLAIGTALVTFMNTLVSSIGAAVNGILFDSAGTNIELGMRNIFILTTVVSAAGVVLSVCVIRKFFVAKNEN